MNILLTGGLGYIGSHVAVALLNSGYTVVLIDNLSNSHATVVEDVYHACGRSPIFLEGDLCDTDFVHQVLVDYKISSVIHLAGLKSVPESAALPVKYYQNNVSGSVSLLHAMLSADVKRLIFSSSATVYGDPKCLPIDEKHPLNPTNPYGKTKLFVEQLLSDVAASDPGWQIVSLRYFNPGGAHESGFLGEDPKGTPGNLLPYLLKVASNSISCAPVYGADYETKDGTGERDYIHIEDLADGHVAALRYICESSVRVGSDADRIGFETFNLGVGQSVSVFEMMSAVENASGKKINYSIEPRRAGDVAVCFADPSKAISQLGWHATRNLSDICESSWKFVCNIDARNSS